MFVHTSFSSALSQDGKPELREVVTTIAVISMLTSLALHKTAKGTSGMDERD